MKKYANNPYLKILKKLPPNEANVIRSEYAQSAYDRLDGAEKQHIQQAIRMLSKNKGTKIYNLGEIGALQLLAATAQYLDSIDWPRKDGDQG